MKVALLGVNEVFENKNSGTSRYVCEVSERLLRDKSMEISKVTANSLPAFIAKTITYDFNKFDIIHSMDYKMAYPRKGKAIWVTSVQDFTLKLHRDLWVTNDVSLKYKLWRQTMLWGVECQLRTDHMITVSEQLKREAISLGYNKDNITTITMGVDSRFINEPISKKDNYKEFRIGYIGGLWFHKNVKFILEIANLRKKEKGEIYEIYGKGNEEANLKNYKEANKLENVNMMGYIPEKEIVRTYDKLDLHIQPTRVEGGALPIFESQARGVPVMIQKGALISEEITKHCLIAEDAEHASTIIEDLKQNGYNEKKRKQAMEYARSFTWERTTKETIGVYKKLL